MELSGKIDIRDYLDIAWRRKWFLIIPFVLTIMATIVYIKCMPEVYRASTLILVEPQKLPTSYVKPTVIESVQDHLRTVTDQIMSRTYLERVINEFNLYPELRQKVPLETVIEKMRHCIEVRVRKRRVFTVSFEDPDPVIAMKVANRLASMFIEENLKVREERAEETLVFLEKELERVRKLLKEQEKKISEFRAKHLGALPEQLEANLRTLDRLQLQLQNTNEALQMAEQTKMQLQQQLSQVKELAKLSNTNSATDTNLIDIDNTADKVTDTTAEEDSQLSKLEKQLALLQLKYTDKHPDIVKLKELIRLRKFISKLEKEKQENPEQNASSEERSSLPESNPLIAQIKAQLAQVNAEISKLKIEREELQKKIKEYQRRVEITPKIEQQLKELTRGYTVTKKEYQSLLDKKLQAELAANMEREQKGEQFKILDPAKLPEKPYKPNKSKLLLVGFVLGLGLGAGCALLVEYMDHSFYKIEDLEAFTNLPVLACIPEFKAKKKKVKVSELDASIFRHVEI